jgi:hypothetical protein
MIHRAATGERETNGAVTSAPAAAADRTGIGQVASVNRSTYPTIVTSGSTGRPAVGCASSD